MYQGFSFPFNFTFTFTFISLFVEHTWHGTCVKDIGQLEGLSSLVPLCRCEQLKSDGQLSGRYLYPLSHFDSSFVKESLQSTEKYRHHMTKQNDICRRLTFLPHNSLFPWVQEWTNRLIFNSPTQTYLLIMVLDFLISCGCSDHNSHCWWMENIHLKLSHVTKLIQTWHGWLSTLGFSDLNCKILKFSYSSSYF